MGRSLFIIKLGARICLCFHRIWPTMGTCKGDPTSLGYSNFIISLGN